jgi:hypothetical protein
MVGSNLPAMGPSEVLEHTRVGWWAGGEAGDPLTALSGSLVRAEIRARCPGLSPLLVYGAPASWAEPGFTGEPTALCFETGASGTTGGLDVGGLDVFVAAGNPEGSGAKTAAILAEAGIPTVAVAPEEGWGMEPHRSVGSPFAVPEPALLSARHFPRSTLDARAAYLRVVEGLPQPYVLVDRSLLDAGDPAAPPRADLEMALRRLAEGPGGNWTAEVVWLAPGSLGDDPSVEAAIQYRRAETEEGRYQPEDWPGDPERPQLALRVTNPLDLAAAVCGAGVVVAGSGAMLALAWALGVPHVALAPEESSASAFAAWTGDASALAPTPGEIVATINNIFARTGRPPGFKRLEATLDESLDEAARNLEETAAGAAANGHRSSDIDVASSMQVQELRAVNEALRQRLAAERLRFGERAGMLEKAAHTTVESAVRAVHGQDVMLRRRLELTEQELRRLQEETAEQQAELREVHANQGARAASPARDLYQRLRKGLR